MGGCLKWILRLILFLIIAVFAGLILGFFLERQVETNDRQRFPAKGQIISVNGSNMHLYCIGSGEKTILMDAGLGGWSVDYMELQPALASDARVCSYDRAGYGWSAPRSTPVTPQVLADELLALMNGAELTEPVILVGYSFSGLHTRLLAIQHPERVSALLLIDPAHEGDLSLYTPELLQQQNSLTGIYGFFGGLARVGVLRLIDLREMALYAPFIGQNRSEEYYAFVGAPQWWETSQLEFSAMMSANSGDQIRAAGNLPENLPFTVISAGAFPAEMPESIQTGRLALLESLVAQVPGATLMFAEGVEHNNLLQQTELIRDALRPFLQ